MSKKISRSLFDKEGFEANSREMQFAMEMAEILNDREALPLYIAFTRQYPESLLREVLEKVRAIPDHKIKKTRGALFNFLVQQHARSRSFYSRN